MAPLLHVFASTTKSTEDILIPRFFVLINVVFGISIFILVVFSCACCGGKQRPKKKDDDEQQAEDEEKPAKKTTKAKLATVKKKKGKSDDSKIQTMPDNEEGVQIVEQEEEEPELEAEEEEKMSAKSELKKTALKGKRTAGKMGKLAIAAKKGKEKASPPKVKKSDTMLDETIAPSVKTEAVDQKEPTFMATERASMVKEPKSQVHSTRDFYNSQPKSGKATTDKKPPVQKNDPAYKTLRDLDAAVFDKKKEETKIQSDKKGVTKVQECDIKEGAYWSLKPLGPSTKKAKLDELAPRQEDTMYVAKTEVFDRKFTELKPPAKKQPQPQPKKKAVKGRK